MTAELKQNFNEHVLTLQNEITQKLRDYDPQIELLEDNWQRTDFRGNPGGGGRTRVFQGNLIENAGVNTSLVHGAVDPAFGKSLKGGSDEIWATGISMIVHPRNPRVPTVHMNFRMIQNGEAIWFGGGADLTPYYPYPEDFAYFHQIWKKACAPYNCYEEMKKECDHYFTNHHRDGEMRGIGGIFFDHFNTGNLQSDYDKVIDLSKHFIESYFPILAKRKDEQWTEEDEDFMLHRRGRYVEFNLIHDRGTLFGLKSNGRTESILVSLPARCKFSYMYSPKENSPHAEMMKYYRPKDWA